MNETGNPNDHTPIADEGGSSTEEPYDVTTGLTATEAKLRQMGLMQAIWLGLDTEPARCVGTALADARREEQRGVSLDPECIDVLEAALSVAEIEGEEPRAFARAAVLGWRAARYSFESPPPAARPDEVTRVPDNALGR